MVQKPRIETACAAFLDSFARPEQASTRRTYTEVLAQLRHSPLAWSDPVDLLDDPHAAATSATATRTAANSTRGGALPGD